MIRITNKTQMNICVGKYPNNCQTLIQRQIKSQIQRQIQMQRQSCEYYHFYLYLHEYHQVKTRVSNNKFVDKYRPKISREAGFPTDWRNIWQDFFRCSCHNSNGHKQLILREIYKDREKYKVCREIIKEKYS